jgi:hypothetical protein
MVSGSARRSVIFRARCSALIHDVYDRIVKANLKKLSEKIRHECRAPRQMTATFDHWFDGSGVLIARRTNHFNGSSHECGEDRPAG